MFNILFISLNAFAMLLNVFWPFLLPFMNVASESLRGSVEEEFFKFNVNRNKSEIAHNSGINIINDKVRNKR